MPEMAIRVQIDTTPFVYNSLSYMKISNLTRPLTGQQ